MAAKNENNLTPDQIAALQGDESDTSRGPQLQPMSLMTWLALAYLVGTWAGMLLGGPWVWLVCAVAAAVAAFFASKTTPLDAFEVPDGELFDEELFDDDEPPPPPTFEERLWEFIGPPLSTSLKLIILAAALLAAARGAHHEYYMAVDDIGRYTGRTAQLARVEGVIADEPGFTDPDRGAFAAYGYRPPATLFLIDVRRMQVGNDWREAEGRLLVRVKMADHRLRQGGHIRAAGWLGSIGGPLNPGDFDHRLRFDRLGIRGRLSVAEASGIAFLDEAGPTSWFGGMRQTIADEAGRSLNLGISTDEPELGLLRALLLGRRDSISRDTQDAFRHTGLAHLLAISGAHLGILMFITWGLVRLFCARPRVTAGIVLLILAGYLLIVPWSTPIIRAGIMAAAFAAGDLFNRPMRTIDTLSAAAMFLLVIAPAQAFDAGFQLSFGIVIALMLFTRPLSLLIWPLRDPDLSFDGEYQIGGRIMRFASDYLSANIVAFLIATPIVAYHFQMITPFAVLLSLLALPVVVAVLSMGYLKILVGFVVPSLGLLLADMLLLCGDTLANLVHRASAWPGSVVHLAQQPPVIWVLVSEVVVFVLLTGWLRNYRVALTGACTICVIWLACTQPQVQRWPADVLSRQPALRAVVPASIVPEKPAARVSMFAVGDGSCILVQIAGDETTPPFNLMFDCGSQQYLDLGSTSIAPSLKSLGVTQVDLLALSHSDIDHFGGALDVADEVPIRRVIVSPQLLKEADAHPRGATRFLIDGLRSKAIPFEAASTGWQMKLGKADARLLWPHADFVPHRSANDASLVMRIDVAGRTILLCGDIQQQAMTHLLADPESIRADIAELPHHGSYHDLSETWVSAVNPEATMQSCGPMRMHHDRWADFFSDSPIHRLVTARSGMVQVEVHAGGRLEFKEFLQNRPIDEGEPAY